MAAYDREANKIFARRVREWAAIAPDEAQGYPERETDANPVVAQIQRNGVVDHLLLGPEAGGFDLSGIEEYPGGVYFHFDGWRTPVCLDGNIVRVCGRVIGRVDARRGLVLDEHDRPMSPKSFALLAAEALDDGLAQTLFENEEAFFNARPERLTHDRSLSPRDLSFIHDAGQTIRISYSPATKELYVVKESGEVELIAEGIDGQEASECATCPDLATLRKSVGDHAPVVSLLGDLTAGIREGPDVDSYDRPSID